MEQSKGHGAAFYDTITDRDWKAGPFSRLYYELAFPYFQMG